MKIDYHDVAKELQRALKRDLNYVGTPLGWLSSEDILTVVRLFNKKLKEMRTEVQSRSEGNLAELEESFPELGEEELKAVNRCPFGNCD